jgi:hypothetical protein
LGEERPLRPRPSGLSVTKTVIRRRPVSSKRVFEKSGSASAGQRCRRGESNSHPELPGLGPQRHAVRPPPSASVCGAGRRLLAVRANVDERPRTKAEPATVTKNVTNATFGWLTGQDPTRAQIV